MANTEWALSDDLKKRVASLASDLTAEASELRFTFDDKSESWQEGSKGSDVSAWIEELEELSTTLENLDTSK